MSWTQPLCSYCWPAWCIGHHGQLVSPVVSLDHENERCCVCGRDTDAGIYIRADPMVVPYPMKEDE